MRFKKNPTRLPYSDELLAQQSLTLLNSHDESHMLNGLHNSSKQIKKSNKITAIANIKQQKRLRLQNYRSKLLSDPKKNHQPELDEDDERLIDFLRKYNEYQEKQNSIRKSSSPPDLDQPSSSSSHEKKSLRKTKMTKLERAMKDLECTLVHGNSLPNLAKPKPVATSKRGILKTKKMNLLRNYRQQKLDHELLEKEEMLRQDFEMGIVGMDVNKPYTILDELKIKLINSVIEKDEREESAGLNKSNLPSESREEETPISMLIRSNEMQILKSNGLENDREEESQHLVPMGEGDGSKEEEIVDEKVRKKIQKQLNIDVTDKYNFLKQSTRTKLRPKCAPDFDLKRFRKNRYRIAKSKKLKKINLLSENSCGQNHFLGFDKSIKRFKDEQISFREASDANSLANKSYFNWDGFTVTSQVKTVETSQCRNPNAVGFRDELDFLTYSLVHKKAQCTQNLRLQQRLELWMRICKTRKDLQAKASNGEFHLIENRLPRPELNCDNLSERLGCDKAKLLLAVPNTSPSPYLEITPESIGSWRERLNRSPAEQDEASVETKSFKCKMRSLIKQMILQKQLRCNSTYAAYDISDQTATNLYEDKREDTVATNTLALDVNEEEGQEKLEGVHKDTSEDPAGSCKTSRISYYTSGNYINFSVNLQTPLKRRMSDLLDSENTSLDSSSEHLPQAHINKIEELYTDEASSDHPANGDESSLCEELMDRAGSLTTASLEILDDTSRDSSELRADSATLESQITASLGRELMLSNKPEHNGLITSFLDYGNGQNTKRRKKKSDNKPFKTGKPRRGNVNGVRSLKKCKLYGKNIGQYSGEWRKFCERRGQVLPPRQIRTVSSESPLDSSGESNSNSYESMYDLVKTKTRHSLSKSIFNFENCTFPRKDGDVFYTTLSLNASDIPLLALRKTKRPLPDFLFLDAAMREHQVSLRKNSPKLSMKINKFTKLQIFVIYLKNVYFLFFKN